MKVSQNNYNTYDMIDGTLHTHSQNSNVSKKIILLFIVAVFQREYYKVIKLRYWSCGSRIFKYRKEIAFNVLKYFLLF